MALSEKHRSAIYQNLSPLVGEEPMDAWLSQHPTRETDEPATKDFVHAEIGDLRGELRVGLANVRSEVVKVRADLVGEIGDVRSDLGGEIGDLRSEMREGFANVRADLKSDITSAVDGVRSEMTKAVEGVRAEVNRLQYLIVGVLASFVGSLVILVLQSR